MKTADHIRVLLVEDSDSDAFLVRAALRSGHEFDVSRVSTLSEARAALENAHRFDVLIADLNLPDSPHDNTLAFLLHEREHLPVVVLNSCDDPILEEKCGVAGAVCYSKQRLLDQTFIQIVRQQLDRVAH